MTMAPKLTPPGLPPQGSRLSSPQVKLKAGSEGAEYPSSSEKNLGLNRGSFPGGLEVPKRVGRGMTAQPHGSTIMGGCLTEIARGNEMKNYVNEPSLGSTNQHPSFAFPRLLLLRLRTGMVAIMTPLMRPREHRARLTTCWKGAQTRLPGLTVRAPSVP